MDNVDILKLLFPHIKNTLDSFVNPIDIFFNVCSHIFSYSKIQHPHFFDAINESFYALSVRFREATSNIYRTRKARGGREKIDYNDYIPLIQLDDVGFRYLTRLVRKNEYRNILSYVLLKTKWISSVKEMNEIPPTLYRAFRTCDVDIYRLFSRINEKDITAEKVAPLFFELSFCSQRVKRYLSQKENTKEMTISIDNMYGRSSSSSSSEDSSSSNDDLSSSPPTSPYQENSIDPIFSENLHGCSIATTAIATSPLLEDSLVMMRENEKIAITINGRIIGDGGINVLGITILVHPYTLSIVTYTVAVYLEKQIDSLISNKQDKSDKEWNVKYIYMELRDIIASSEKRRFPFFSNKKTEPINDKVFLLNKFAYHILHASYQDDMYEENTNLISRKLLDERLWLDIKKAFFFFGKNGGYTSLHFQKTSFSRFCRLNMKLGTIKKRTDILVVSTDDVLFDSDEIEANGHTLDYLFPENYALLEFDREEVKPLSMYTSLHAIRKKFQPKDFWKNVKLTYDRNIVTLAITQSLLSKIQTMYIPYLCTNYSILKRGKLNCPIYPLHIRNYLSNEPERILFSIMSLVKLFYRSNGLLTSGVFPLPSDPVIECYKLLAFIMDRFQNEDILLSHLIFDLNQTEFLWFRRSGLCRSSSTLSNEEREKKRKSEEESLVCGFKMDHLTFYTALRAFCYIYCEHTISWLCVDRLIMYFTVENTNLQHYFPFQFALLKKLRDTREKWGCVNQILIPYDFQFKEDSLDNPFPYPAHLLLYYMCASEHITDEYAKMIFFSMDVKIKRETAFSLASSSYDITDKGNELQSILYDSFMNHRYQKINEKREDKEEEEEEEDEEEKMNGMDVDVDNLKQNPTHGLVSLFKNLERLSFFPIRCNMSQVTNAAFKNYRGHQKRMEQWLPISHEETISDEFPFIPIQYKTILEPQTIDNLFPIWNSEFFETSLKIMQKKLHKACSPSKYEKKGKRKDRKRKIPSKNKGEKSKTKERITIHMHNNKKNYEEAKASELTPLSGCSEDLIELVILYPCMNIQMESVIEIDENLNVERELLFQDFNSEFIFDGISRYSDYNTE